MDGIINVNKPKGITSFDVVRKLRKILNIRKIGHTGTLDPMATGVLVICIGGATKLVNEIEAKEKVYIAEMELGYSTDTYDLEGKVVKSSEKNTVCDTELQNILIGFVGEQEQEPPMYSAIKVNGKKLYELARQNIEIERKKRAVNIEYINLISNKESKICFETKVSKGTYIRSLVNDIGEKLKTFATMTELQRTSVGEYKICDSFDLEKIEKLASENDFSFVKTVEESFAEFTRYEINNENMKLYMNGNKQRLDIDPNEKWRIYNQGKFIGLGISDNESFLKPYKYFLHNEVD